MGRFILQESTLRLQLLKETTPPVKRDGYLYAGQERLEWPLFSHIEWPFDATDFAHRFDGFHLGRPACD